MHTLIHTLSDLARRIMRAPVASPCAMAAGRRTSAVLSREELRRAVSAMID